MNNFFKFTSYKFTSYKTIAIMFISMVIIIICAYSKSFKEGLTNNNQVILMGDSILNNANYVPSGSSVLDNLKTTFSNILNTAKDGATINDLYGQLNNISVELNTTETYIFISAGGNDILNKTNKLSSTDIIQLFNTYMDFLKALRAKLTSAKINIMNLYLPANPRYQSYKEIIDQWNQLITQHSTKIGEMYNVVDLSSLLTTPADFVYDIEPSITASKKIANLITGTPPAKQS